MTSSGFSTLRRRVRPRDLFVVVTLALAGCDRVASQVKAASAAIASLAPGGTRPPQSFLGERLLPPPPEFAGVVTSGEIAPLSITVSQVETYYGGPGGQTRWRAVGDGAYALDVSGNDALTHKAWKLTLLFTPAALPAGTEPQLAIDRDESFARITRLLQDGQELDQDDIGEIEGKVLAAKIPLPADVLARRQMMLPACDSDFARDQLTKLGGIRDPASLNPAPPILQAITDIRQTDVGFTDMVRGCSATEQLDIGPRAVTYNLIVRNGAPTLADARQVWYQPRPPASAAAPAEPAQPSDVDAPHDDPAARPDVQDAEAPPPGQADRP